MTEEEHKQTHIELHQKFDELLADFISHKTKKLLSSTSILEIIEWSYKQTQEPDE